MRGGSKPRYTEDWFVEQVVRLYRSGRSVKQVAQETLISTMGVKNVLRRAGVVLRAKRWNRHTCVDCAKPARGLRCDYHRRIRKAYLDRMAQRRMKRIPRERWVA